MKNTIYFIAMLLISISSISCASDDDLNYQSDFEKSQKVLTEFKASSNNSYQYVVTGSSFSIPNSWETTITVSNGVVIQRDFLYTGTTQNIPDDQLKWTENQSQINTHQSSNAASAITLDEVYSKAEKEWLIKSKNTTSYFETKNNGLISTCGYVENGCMDDCFTGINIKSITKLQ